MMLSQIALLFAAYLQAEASSTTSILVTCTQSHVVLIDPPFATIRTRLPSHCQQRRIHTVFIENRINCVNHSDPLIVDATSNDGRSTSSELFAITCPAPGKEVIHEQLSPTQMEIQMFPGSEGSLHVEILERNVLLVAARYAVPTLCQLISEEADDVKVYVLTDEGGCAVSKDVAPMMRKLLERGTLYSTRLNSSLFDGRSEQQIQCSVVACGEQCIKNKQVCNPRRTAFSNSMVITKKIDKSLMASLMLNRVEAQLEECPWFLHRTVLTVLNVGLLALSGVVWFIAIKALLNRRNDLKEMLKHAFTPTRRQSRPRVEIIHPMDSFSSPPSVSSDTMSTIKLKLAKLSTRGRRTGRYFVEALRSSSPPSSSLDEHLSVNELHSSTSSAFVTSSLMDSLPDPPYLSVQKLPELERALRTTESSQANLPCKASGYNICPPEMTSDDLPSPEYLNLQPVPRTRPSKCYPRIDSLFTSDPPTISLTSNLETTSFIEQLDVTTLLMTQSIIPKQQKSQQFHDNCIGTHRILIDQEYEFSSTVNDAEVIRHIEDKSRGTIRSLNDGSSEEIVL